MLCLIVVNRFSASIVLAKTDLQQKTATRIQDEKQCCCPENELFEPKRFGSLVLDRRHEYILSRLLSLKLFDSNHRSNCFSNSVKLIYTHSYVVCWYLEKSTNADCQGTVTCIT